MYDNRDTVVELSAEHFELPVDVVDAFFLTEFDYFREDPVTDVDRMQQVVDDLEELGFVESFNTEEYIDNQYVDI
jgi:hypothetical protein